jgi:hypothetical protein
MIKVLRTLIMLILGFVHLKAQNPNWIAPTPSSFQFSAIYVGAIYLDGIVSNHAEDVVAFFDDEEIRGLGSAVSLGNGMYIHFITIYSHHGIDTLDIKVYHKNTNHVFEVQQPIIFQVQSIIGSVDNPYIFNIYPDNDAPISLLPVPSPTTLAGVAFQPVDMFDYLVQPDPFAVDWSYTSNPNLIANFQGSILSVSAAVGFTGETQLVVRATEQSLSMWLENQSYSSRLVQTQQFAEITITFKVDTLYVPPMWLPEIPGQGILKGEQFDTISLHDFENQFQGPLIKYDYKPVLTEKVPPVSVPSWENVQSPETTMNVIASVNYTPKYQFNHANDVLGAFVGDKVVGMAQRNVINGLYYLSIGSDNINDSIISLKFYSGAMKDVLIVDSAFLYQPFAILGNAESPLDIDFAPIIPIIPDTLVGNGVCLMPLEIVDEDFIGSVTFTFIASDPVYPQFLFDETNATFCIVSDTLDLFTYYQDTDGDGLGNPSFFIKACQLLQGYVTNNLDCNDGDPDNSASIISITENSGIPNDGYLCSGATTILSVSNPASSYLWNMGQTTQSIEINPNVSSQFTVTVSLGNSCAEILNTNIFVEGKVVQNNLNIGFGSLRNVIACALNGDSITYDLPLTDNTVLTQSLAIDKSITISGTLQQNPEITLDFDNMSEGIIIQSGKTLNLHNIDVKLVNQNFQGVFSGFGNVNISGSTKIIRE